MTVRPDPPVDPPADYLTNMMLIAGEQPSVTDLDSNVDSVPPVLQEKKAKEKKGKKKKKKCKRKSESKRPSQSAPPVKQDGKPMGIVEEVARVLNLYLTSEDEDDAAAAIAARRRGRRRHERSSSPGSQGLPVPKKSVLKTTTKEWPAPSLDQFFNEEGQFDGLVNGRAATVYELEDLESRSQASKASNFIENNSIVREILGHLFFKETKDASRKIRNRFSIKGLEDEELPTCGDNMSLWGDRSFAGIESVGNRSMPALGRNFEAPPRSFWMGFRRGSVVQSSASVTPVPESLVIHETPSTVFPKKDAQSLAVSKSSSNSAGQDNNCTLADKDTASYHGLPAPGKYWEAGSTPSWSAKQRVSPIQSCTSINSMPTSIVVKGKQPVSTHQNTDRSVDTIDSSYASTTQQGGVSSREIVSEQEGGVSSRELEQVPPRERTEIAKKTGHQQPIPHPTIRVVDASNELQDIKVTKTAMPRSLIRSSETSPSSKQVNRSSLSTVFGISFSTLREESIAVKASGARRNSIFGILLGSDEVVQPAASVGRTDPKRPSAIREQPAEESQEDKSIPTKKMPDCTLPLSTDPPLMNILQQNEISKRETNVRLLSEPLPSLSGTLSVNSRSLPQQGALEPKIAKNHLFGYTGDEDDDDDDEDLDEYIESLVARELNTRARSGDLTIGCSLNVATSQDEVSFDKSASENIPSENILSVEQSVDEQGSDLSDGEVSADPLVALEASINEHLEALKDGLDKTPRKASDLGVWFDRNADRTKVLSSVEDRSNYGDIESVEGYSLQESLLSRRSGRLRRVVRGVDKDLGSVDEDHISDESEESPVNDDEFLNGSSSERSYSDSDDPDDLDAEHRDDADKQDTRRNSTNSLGSGNSAASQDDQNMQSHSGGNSSCSQEDYEHGEPCQNEWENPRMANIKHLEYTKEQADRANDTDDLTDEPPHPDNSADNSALPQENNAIEERAIVDIMDQETQSRVIGPMEDSDIPDDLEAEKFQPREIKIIDEKPLQLDLNSTGPIGSESEKFMDFPRHDGTACFRYRSQEWKESTGDQSARAVSFDKVIIREHNLCPGDNPACSDSLPISLDWDHGPVRVWAIDDFEKVKYMFPIPEDAEGMARRLSWVERRDLLMEVGGYTDKDIRLAETSFAKMLDDDRKALEGNKPSGFFSRLFSPSKRGKSKSTQSIDEGGLGEASAEEASVS